MAYLGGRSVFLMKSNNYLLTINSLSNSFFFYYFNNLYVDADFCELRKLNYKLNTGSYSLSDIRKILFYLRQYLNCSKDDLVGFLRNTVINILKCFLFAKPNTETFEFLGSLFPVAPFDEKYLVEVKDYYYNFFGSFFVEEQLFTQLIKFYVEDNVSLENNDNGEFVFTVLYTCVKFLFHVFILFIVIYEEIL
jgi:hypothetical protein